MTTRLITGATGFVGGAIVLELIERTPDRVLALVRADDDAAAQQRLVAELTTMAHGYGKTHLVAAIADRVQAVSGDVLAPHCGLDARLADLPAVDEIWHVAASLKFEEEHRAEIEAINIGGTENVVALAGALDVRALTYVSTAYVVGRSSGSVAEAEVTDFSVANNCYEESKLHAEQVVLSHRDELRVRILRPSIVIGHSQTRHGLNWSGMYGFARQVLLFRRAAERSVGTFLRHARIRLLADPIVAVNLVPVDVVARNAVTIGLSDSPHTFFHLTNANTVTVRDTIQTIFDLIGLREPLWVPDSDGFTSLDELLDKGMDFYRSYLRNDKSFGLEHTVSVCGTDAVSAPINAGEVAEYCLAYLSQQRGFVRLQDAPDRVLHRAAV